MAKRTCAVPECERDLYARSWCQMHYDRWRIHGSTELPKRERITGVPCSIDDCDKLAVGRSWCPMHWYRWKTHGSTDLPAGPERPDICSADGCDESAKVPGSARGFCRRHYQQLYGIRRRKGSSAGVPRSRPKRQAAECVTETCSRKPVAKGLCSWHYTLTRRQSLAICTVADCSSPEHAKGMCANHYAYTRRHGSPTPQFICRGCGLAFSGRANTLHCSDCKPTPNVYAQTRKARLAANNADMTEADRAESAEYRAILQADPCAYCGAPSTAIDHILPTVEGGSDRWDNLAPVCKPCNSTKRTRSVLSMLLGRGAP